eukprot:69948-Pyramimonas_sp.AAC.2
MQDRVCTVRSSGVGTLPSGQTSRRWRTRDSPPVSRLYTGAHSGVRRAARTWDRSNDSTRTGTERCEAMSNCSALEAVQRLAFSRLVAQEPPPL